MPRWRWLALVVCATPAVAAAQSTVRTGHLITPDTVTVGQPFRVEIRVRAPKGTSITFPAGPDSTAGVQALDPRTVRDAHDSGAVDQTAIYRLAAWDVGTQALALPDLVISAQGRQERVPLAALHVFVKSVLPADTALRVPKPARDLLVTPLIPWWVWALLAAAIIAVAWWLWRRFRRREPVPVAIDAFTRAEREFARIESLGLVESGERGRFVTLIIEVLRDYLAARYPEAALSLTTSELSAVLRGQQAVPLDRLGRLLLDVDLVKFARRIVTTEQALDVAREAKAIVAHEHAASAPAVVPEAKAA